MSVELVLAIIGAEVSTLLVLALRSQHRLGRVLERLQEHDRRITRLESHTFNAHARDAGARSSAAD